MKYLVLITLCAGTLAWAAPAPVSAAPGVINRACQQANRSAATPRLCGCIQRVANDTLRRSERRKVAKFFRDPHRAQKVRQSSRRGDEILWKRYKAFGERAEAVCS